MSRELLTLRDGEIALRSWRDEDAPAIAAACSDAQVRRWLPVPNPYSEADGLEYVRGCRARWERGPDAPFAIVDVDSDRVLGSIDRHGPDGHRASIGYWLAPHARGRGIATRAVTLLTGWTFVASETVRLEIRVAAGNGASAAVAERAGFRREGTLRSWELLHGVPTDYVFFSMVRGVDV